MRQRRGFNNPDSFKSFIISNEISKQDNNNHNLSEKIIIKIRDINIEKEYAGEKYMSYSDKVEFGIIVTISAFLLFFVFRYIYYAIKWSLIVLNTK